MDFGPPVDCLRTLQASKVNVIKKLNIARDITRDMGWNLLLELFLKDLVSQVTTRFPNQVVSIVLFGSATTGEWVRGKSDIDCIILIKDKKMRKQVELFLNQTLLELDSKYDLKLSDTCSTYKKTQNHALNLVLKIESFGMFGRPFYVLSEDQIDLKNAKLKDDFKTFVGTHVIASTDLFLHRIKCTGKILYGKDVTKEFPTRIPFIEKIKAPLNAIILLMISFLVMPIDSRFAMQHAVKANFWACDNVLFAMDQPLSNAKSEIKHLQDIFSHDLNESDVAHLNTSLKYKTSRKILKAKNRFVIRYAVKSTRFVLKLYSLTIQKWIATIR